MQSTNASTKISENPSPKKLKSSKLKTLIEFCKLSKSNHPSSFHEFKMEFSPTQENTINFQSLRVYASQLVQQVYEPDLLGIGRIMSQFLANDLPKQRQRIQERLSLLKYEVNSLKYRPFGDVEHQILKQWRKNVLFFSLNTIWATKLQAHKLSSISQFTDQYHKQVTLISNLTHFYFKEALAILDSKTLATFSYLQEETAHKILNAMQSWKEIYEHTMLPLIRKKSLEQQLVMDLNYDLRNVHVNPQYLDLFSGKAQLVQTTERIRDFANQSKIYTKIEQLKQIRATFIKEIEQSRLQIAKTRQSSKSSPLEKDDIIGCMIYCIIKGSIKQIQGSIQSIGELLGPNNQLLSRRGVDSYRADLQIAVEYLCQQGEVCLITGHKPMLQQQIKSEIANKITQLELSDLN